MNWEIGRTVSLFALLLTFTSACMAQEGDPLPLLREWSGSLDPSDTESIPFPSTSIIRALQKVYGLPQGNLRAADGSVCLIVDATYWEMLWASWRFSDELPQVDFSDEFAVVATTLGSRPNLSTTVDVDGRLTVDVIAGSDVTPGFHYVIASVLRNGVETVNGEQLPED